MAKQRDRGLGRGMGEWETHVQNQLAAFALVMSIFLLPLLFIQ